MPQAEKETTSLDGEMEETRQRREERAEVQKATLVIRERLGQIVRQHNPLPEAVAEKIIVRPRFDESLTWLNTSLYDKLGPTIIYCKTKTAGEQDIKFTLSCSGYPSANWKESGRVKPVGFTLASPQLDYTYTLCDSYAYRQYNTEIFPSRPGENLNLGDIQVLSEILDAMERPQASFTAEPHAFA